jgi:hypothetical protein
MPSSPDARITLLRKRLEKLRGCMLGPMVQSSVDAIEQSIPGLTEAAEELAALSEEIASYPPAPGPQREKLVREFRRLRADLSRLAALSAQGLEFCRKWSHVIQSAAGYLPSGEAAPIAESTTILVRG